MQPEENDGDLDLGHFTVIYGLCFYIITSYTLIQHIKLM